MVLPMDGDRKPFLVARSNFNETLGRFSPDGRWIAYLSDESGRIEVYVQSFPQASERWQISINGGLDPEWRGDGRELFYLAPDDRLMAVPIRFNGNSSTIDIGKPIALFTTRPQSGYDVTPDGQRFLLNTSLADAPTPPITVILNWQPRQ